MTARTRMEVAEQLGISWFDYQIECFDVWDKLPRGGERLCLYYRTGAGKSITALACLALSGYTSAVVVAPPSTHNQWSSLGEQLGISIEVMSHSKFRSSFKAKRDVPIIADEFHQFGGTKGKGWTKLDRIARGLKAPVILCSATPNYNDAERCFCVQHILDPAAVKGGLIEFIYQHCETRQNPFGMMPIVEGFRLHDGAAGYLSSLPNVVYVPDETDVKIVDIEVQTSVPDEYETYGLDRRRGRIVASDMEKRFYRQMQNLIDDDGFIREHVYDEIGYLVGQASTPALIYCNSETVAQAMARSCKANKARYDLVTGKMSTKRKHEIIDKFRRGLLDVLIGTATLATGTDGLDKVCDLMVIVHDTDDDSLRRQLVGRILPRGADSDTSLKQIFRLVF